MKYSFFLLLLVGAAQAIKIQEKASDKMLINLQEPCEEALEVSQAELDIQLDYFSRRLDKKYYDNAMKIYGELTKQGKNPKLSVHTYELYDNAFSFPRVRRYELVQQQLDNIQHF